MLVVQLCMYDKMDIVDKVDLINSVVVVVDNTVVAVDNIDRSRNKRNYSSTNG